MYQQDPVGSVFSPVSENVTCAGKAGGNGPVVSAAHLDMDGATVLSGYDRERVCVPNLCDCGWDDCCYFQLLDACGTTRKPFRICNYNLLLVAAIHRARDGRPTAVLLSAAHGHALVLLTSYPPFQR